MNKLIAGGALSVIVVGGGCIMVSSLMKTNSSKIVSQQDVSPSEPAASPAQQPSQEQGQKSFDWWFNL